MDAAWLDSQAFLKETRYRFGRLVWQYDGR